MQLRKHSETIVNKVYPVPEKPTYLPGTQIEIINPDIERGHVKHAVLDFDGTVSVLREGWPEIMLPVMVDAIRGDHPSTPEIVERCEKFIDETTGIQTFFQMEGLVKMVEEFGLVPKEKILDAWGYKAVYNDALMVPVNARIADLASGKLTLDDATMHGSRQFLKAIFDRGVRIYLASGTDQDDVRNEAHACQIDQWATGGIWGAIRNVEDYSKDKVMKDIISQNNLHGAELMVLGDGPVEIRNAKDNGAIAIGVASDEVKCEGLNPHKRQRLIKAGADILIPDFLEWEKLIGYLFNA
jgi:phosphoglycolate phosphatase-like HAD superfamily hydrolase